MFVLMRRRPPRSTQSWSSAASDVYKRQELDLSNLGTFTAQNTITIQGEITEVAVSGGDYTTSNLPVLNGNVFTSTGEKQPYEVTVTAVYTEGHSGHTAIAGKDLQEIYEWASNWDWLFDVASETVDDISSESPATIRASLNKAGWTDDAIWQAHIDICAEQMPAQDQAIRQLEDQKRKNHLALQVRHKVGCVPDSRDLDRLLKYEGSIERQFYKAVDQLERLQRLRAGDPVLAPVNVDLAINTGDTV